VPTHAISVFDVVGSGESGESASSTFVPAFGYKKFTKSYSISVILTLSLRQRRVLLKIADHRTMLLKTGGL